MKTFLCFSILLRATTADITWPEYNQQCRDDAGPPFLDDEPGVKYHDTNSAAYPILQNNACPKPLEYACSARPDPKTAYLEGPIDCGDKGWYCRIMPDESWPPVNLIPDVNFGHCNTTAGIEDAGFDQDGHCHGSSKDNTYYWWIRDHWHRGYNGRVRCCCGWFVPAPGSNGANTALYDRRIANRCDYRRQLSVTEDPEQCRDANEDHGMGFDDIGCDPQKTTDQIGSPIPESDDYCWEIAQFGFSENLDAPSSVTLSPAAPPFASSAPISNTATPNVQPSSAPASNDVPAPISVPTEAPVGTPTSEPIGTPTSEPVGTPTSEPGNGYYEPGNGYYESDSGDEGSGSGDEGSGSGDEGSGSGDEAPGSADEAPGSEDAETGSEDEEPPSLCFPLLYKFCASLGKHCNKNPTCRRDNCCE